jgi:hypothetical protein
LCNRNSFWSNSLSAVASLLTIISIAAAGDSAGVTVYVSRLASGVREIAESLTAILINITYVAFHLAVCWSALNYLWHNVRPRRE